MKTSDSIDKIAPALVALQAEMGTVAQSGKNNFDDYSYAKLLDYKNTTKPILSKHGLSVVSSTEEVTEHGVRKTKSGGDNYVVFVSINVRLIHSSGQWIEITSKGEGQDRADKSTYKAVTGARKYADASLFNLATKDDPEGDETVGRDAYGGVIGAKANKREPSIDDLLAQPTAKPTNNTIEL